MYDKRQFITDVNRFLVFHQKNTRLSENNFEEKILSLGVSEFEVLLLTAKIFEEIFDITNRKDVFTVKSKITENSTFSQWFEAIACEVTTANAEKSSNVIDLQAYARRKEGATNITSTAMPHAPQTLGSGFFIPDATAIKIESAPESKKQRKFLQSLLKVLEYPSSNKDTLKEQLEQTFNILK